MNPITADLKTLFSHFKEDNLTDTELREVTKSLRSKGIDKMTSHQWSEFAPTSKTPDLTCFFETKVNFKGYTFRVKFSPVFSLLFDHFDTTNCHIQFYNEGDSPLPFTSTGYRSEFMLLRNLKGMDFPEFLKCYFSGYAEAPKVQQLSLF